MRRPLLVLSLLLVSLSPAVAQYALDVDTIVGFSGVFRAGSWTPVHVTVQNLGKEVRGTLELEVERGDRFGPNRTTVRYSRTLEVVSGAGKAFSFVIPLETTIYPLTIRIRDGETTAHEEAYDLLGRSVPARLALVLARRPNLDFLLPLYNTQERRVLDVVYPLPNYLPEEWHGYEAVDTMVIHDVRLQELGRGQVDAIRDWVASGGRLVLSGGAHFGPADAETLEPLGDFRTSGITTVAVDEAGLLELGLPLEPGERDARVVATEFVQGGTRMRRIPLGRGDVILIPADYANLVQVAPLSSVALWNSLLSRSSSEDAIATELRRRVFETDTLANQLTLPLYDFPSRILVLGLAASFIIGTGGLLYWLYAGRSRSRAWLGAPSIIAMIVVVTAAGHLSLTVSLQPVEALALSIERAEVSGDDGFALVTRDTALFSRQLGEYEVRYRDSPLLIPMEDRDHTVVTGADRTTQTMTIPRWGYDNNLAVQIVPFDLQSRARAESDFVSIEITNRTDQRVTGLVMLRNGFPEALGSLAPGETLEHVATDVPSGDFQSVEWERFVSSDAYQENRARLVGDIARLQRFQDRAAADVIVVGWTERALLPATVSPPFSRTIDLHIVTIPIFLGRGEQ